MRLLTLIVTLSLSVTSYASKQVSHLVAPPPGATLPVVVNTSMKSGKLAAGQQIIAHFIQRVPVAGGDYLPPKVQLVGHVVHADSSSFSIAFTQLRWKNETVPVRLRLVCAASSYSVFQAGMPVGGTDRGTADPQDWTTRQVGGDQVYRSAGWGKVYDQYSRPVGYADLQGIYQNASSPGEPPRAMGPFSTTATGLHGLQGLSIISPGGEATPITFGVNKPRWEIAGGSAWLLQVVS